MASNELDEGGNSDSVKEGIPGALDNKPGVGLLEEDKGPVNKTRRSFLIFMAGVAGGVVFDHTLRWFDKNVPEKNGLSLENSPADAGVRDSSPPKKIQPKKIQDKAEFRNDEEFDLSYFPEEYQKKIAEWEKEYLANPVELEKMANRASGALNDVKEIFKKKKVPEELVYLFFKESSWRPDVVSTSRSTDYGLGQINEETARDMSLSMKMVGKMSYYRRRDSGRGSELYKKMFLFDQRRGVLDAAEAVAKYLIWLKDQCSGSWVFAAWAYNRGVGNIKKFLATSDEYIADSIEEYLDEVEGTNKNVSYEYVGRMLALMRVMRKKEAEKPDKFVKKGIVSVDYNIPTEIKEIRLKSGENPSVLAARYRVNLAKLLKTNRLTSEDATELQIGDKLKIPIEDKRLVTAGMIRKGLGMSAKEFYEWNSGILPPWNAIAYTDYKYSFNYRLQKGETLAKVAKKFKKRGVELDDLQELNEGIAIREGGLIKIKGRFNVRDERPGLEGRLTNMKQIEEREDIMPPLPNGWKIHVPANYKSRLEELIREWRA